MWTHAEFPIPTEIADMLRARLTSIRGPDGLAIAPVTDSPGPRAVFDSLFLPAAARHAYQERFLGASLRIEVKLPPPEPPGPQLLAVDVADRQRRRKTWQENVDRYALPEGASVHVDVEGSLELRQMLGEHGQTRSETARAA